MFRFRFRFRFLHFISGARIRNTSCFHFRVNSPSGAHECSPISFIFVRSTHCWLLSSVSRFLLASPFFMFMFMFLFFSFVLLPFASPFPSHCNVHVLISVFRSNSPIIRSRAHTMGTMSLDPYQQGPSSNPMGYGHHPHAHAPSPYTLVPSPYAAPSASAYAHAHGQALPTSSSSPYPVPVAAASSASASASRQYQYQYQQQQYAQQQASSSSSSSSSSRHAYPHGHGHGHGHAHMPPQLTPVAPPPVPMRGPSSAGARVEGAGRSRRGF